MTEQTTYLQLFTIFSKVGLFTLGGGYAMVPLMEKEVVDDKHWLGREGGIVASMGVAMPSIVIILFIAMFFHAFKGNIYIEKIFRGVRPAVVALIAAPCFKMAKSARINRHNFWIPVLACLLIAAFGVSPIWIILAAGVEGFLYGRMTSKHNEEHPIK